MLGECVYAPNDFTRITTPICQVMVRKACVLSYKSTTHDLDRRVLMSGRVLATLASRLCRKPHGANLLLFGI